MTAHALITTAAPTSPDPLFAARQMAGIAETLVNALQVDGDRVLMNRYDREQIAFAICSTLDAIEAAQAA